MRNEYYICNVMSIDLISNIMSKRNNIFTKIHISNAGKTKNVPEFKFDIF